MAEDAIIAHLPFWIRFPKLPIEYFFAQWLHRVGNKIGRTLKVDVATFETSSGKYARACVEVDLQKPLLTGYRFKGHQGSPSCLLPLR